MGKRPVRNIISNDSNRGVLPRLTFQDPSPEKYLAYVQTKTEHITDFDADYFAEYNRLRSREFAQEFSYNLRRYSLDLQAHKGNKVQRLRSMGIRNTGLYCAELSDKIFDETVSNVGFSEYQGVTSCSNRNYCPTVAKELYQKCQDCNISGGYASHIREQIKTLQDENPYGCYLAVVDSKGNVSGSGLHQVIIAPTIDKDGEFVMGDDGKPKMSVYSFNRESITDLESYNKGGVIYNLCDFAEDNALHQIQKGELTPEQIKNWVDSRKQPARPGNVIEPGLIAMLRKNTNQIG